MEEIDSGIYMLKILLSEPTKIKVGALGEHCFNKGYYFYIGSAQKNLQKRVARHLKNKKRFHWHIDYLLDQAEVIEYFTFKGSKSLECKLFKFLKDIEKFSIPMSDFGSSDCKCTSHLLFSENNLDLTNTLTNFKKDIQ